MALPSEGREGFGLKRWWGGDRICPGRETVYSFKEGGEERLRVILKKKNLKSQSDEGFFLFVFFLK